MTMYKTLSYFVFYTQVMRHIHWLSHLTNCGNLVLFRRKNDFGSCEICHIPSWHVVEKQEVRGWDDMSAHFIPEYLLLCNNIQGSFSCIDAMFLYCFLTSDTGGERGTLGVCGGGALGWVLWWRMMSEECMDLSFNKPCSVQHHETHTCKMSHTHSVTETLWNVFSALTQLLRCCSWSCLYDRDGRKEGVGRVRIGGKERDRHWK